MVDMTLDEYMGEPFRMWHDGVDLSDYFYVVEVTGRSLSPNEIKALTVPGRNGSYFQSKRKPGVPLRVKAMLTHKSDVELRTAIDTLNGILDTDEPVPLVFGDEPDKTYYGILNDISEGYEVRGNHIVTITFFRPDPYKYGLTHHQTIAVPPATFNRDSVAYNEDGTQVAVDVARYKEVEPGNRGILVEEGTTNLVTNPSFETDANADGIADNWTAGTDTTITASRSLDTANKRSGQKSQKISITASTGSGNANVFQAQPVTANTSYTISSYVTGSYVATGKATIYGDWLDVNGAVISSFTAWTGSPTVWTRVSKTLTSPAGATRIRVAYSARADAANDTCDVYWDDVQLEQKSYSTSFTASARTSETLTLPTDSVLFADEGTIEFEVEISENMITNNDYDCIFQVLGESGSTDGWFGLDSANGQWRVATNDGNVSSTNFVDITNQIGDVVLLSIKWKGNDVSLFIDKVLVLSKTMVMPSSFYKDLYIGHASGNRQPNAYFSNIHISRIARPDAEIGTFVVDEHTTAYMDFEGNLVTQAPSTIDNKGTAETFPIIYVKFTASATELKITHDATGDYVRVIRNFAAGDELVIDCAKKKVMYNGVLAMTTLDLYSTWIKLANGDNGLTVTPTDVEIVEITYDERWL